MRRLLLACTTVSFLVVPAWAAFPDCSACKTIKAKGDGWCAHCKQGMVDWISVKSDKLYKAMETSAFHKALEGGKALSAKDIAAMKCADCKRTAEKHGAAWCANCKSGIVAEHQFTSKATYDKAAHAYQVMQSAARAKCEGCAIAMLTDGTCAHCKVSYKDGKMAKETTKTTAGGSSKKY